MRIKYIEAVHGLNVPGNHGKFSVRVLDADDWQQTSAVDGLPLLRARGWSSRHVEVFDEETGEGARFRHGGLAKADLDKHQVWVCPLFEHFLAWLYEQPWEKVFALDLPDVVELPDAPFDYAGYRRPGPPDARKAT